ncbi:MAG: diaminopimelate epimerase [Nitrosomonadales bacterium]|jgi:diaminopimelate epimerase
MKIPFTKMHAIGNDFIVINQTQNDYQLTKQQIIHLANRHTGIGFDQLLIIENPNSSSVDFKYRIFNADGGEVEHCGNGARCFFEFIKKNNLSSKKIIRVETKNSILNLFEEKNLIKIDMGKPTFNFKEFTELNSANQGFVIQSTSGNKNLIGHFVSLGNPHIVFFVDDLNDIYIEQSGLQIQNSGFFSQGINVGFASINSKDEIRLKVFERGSGLTLGCGTGACAATVIGYKHFNLNPLLKVNMPGGSLQVDYSDENQLFLLGDAHIVFEGEITL